jgi:transcriptional regulator with XRE-family HTH domain
MGRKRAGQPRAVRNTVAGRFGRRLEQLATAAGLTTAEFARKAGVTEDAIRKYYRGTDTPRLDRWPRIARALGLKNARDLLPDIPVE